LWNKFRKDKGAAMKINHLPAGHNLFCIRRKEGEIASSRGRPLHGGKTGVVNWEKSCSTCQQKNYLAQKNSLPLKGREVTYNITRRSPPAPFQGDGSSQLRGGKNSSRRKGKV